MVPALVIAAVFVELYLHWIVISLSSFSFNQTGDWASTIDYLFYFQALDGFSEFPLLVPQTWTLGFLLLSRGGEGLLPPSQGSCVKII